MPKQFDPLVHLELPPAHLLPRWCRNPDQSKWWLPWGAHAILTTLNTHHEYQTGGEIFTHAGMGPGNGYPALYQLEELGLVDSAWETERFPEAWAAKGHTEGCGCGHGGRYYNITARGKLWLKEIPLRPRPPYWRRPVFLVPLGMTITWTVLLWFLASH